MSYAQHAENLKRAIAELTATRESNTMKIMLDNIALMKARMINTGKFASGEVKSYSDAEFPYWLFQKQIKNYRKNATPREGHFAAFNPVEKTKELYKKTGYWASYKEWREVTNRVTSFKNFSFTNQMWHGVKPIVIEKSPNSTTYIAWADEKDVIDKLQWNIARDGNILAFTVEETKLIDVLNQQRVFSILRKHKVA